MKNNHNGTLTVNLKEMLFLGAAAVFGPPDRYAAPELYAAYERYQTVVDEEAARWEAEVMDFEDTDMLNKLFVNEEGDIIEVDGINVEV